jgi:hypothetical protein
VQEREHRGSLTIEAQRETAVGEHPRISPFDDPPVATEPLTRVDAATGDPGCDPAPPQGVPAEGEVVALVAVELGWAEARSSRLADQTTNRWDTIDQWLQQLGVVYVSRGEQLWGGTTSGERKSAMLKTCSNSSGF